MNKDTVDGLEFEVTEEKELLEKELTRCCFRVPVTESDKVTIQIGNAEYSVVNMQAGGISFRTKKESEQFLLEKGIVKGTITLVDQIFNVTAQIIHISDDGEFPPLCGLRFTGLSKETAAAFSAFCEVLKERLIWSNKGGIV